MRLLLTRPGAPSRRLEVPLLRGRLPGGRALQAIDGLDAWPEKVKLMQRNWIGRSEGASVTFEIAERTAGHFDGYLAACAVGDVDGPCAAGGDAGEDVVEGDRPLVKAGHRRTDDGPHPRQLEHVLQMDIAEGGFAWRQQQLPPLFDHDIGRTVNQVVA